MFGESRSYSAYLVHINLIGNTNLPSKIPAYIPVEGALSKANISHIPE